MSVHQRALSLRLLSIFLSYRLAALVTALAACALLSACHSPTASPVDTPKASNTAPLANVTAHANVPFVGSSDRVAPKRVLFIQGDHVRDSGYVHSRVRDDGTRPESFTHLRTQVLEQDLGLQVDEIVITAAVQISREQLAGYAVVVLGSNDRVFTVPEVATLTDYYANGGSILTYADFQYGPDNWASDNSFLNQYGIEVLPDNFQPTVDITDIVPTHPVMAGVRAFQGEGISQLRVSGATLTDNQVIARCSPLTRSGCILQPVELARVKPGDVVACVVIRENPRGGRLASVCDRNIFQNGPGPGSDLDQVDNRLFARNLFRWLSK